MSLNGYERLLETPSRVSRMQPLAIRKGDLVVLETDAYLTTDQSDRLRDQVKESVPEGVNVLILPPGIRFNHYRSESSTAE